MTILGVRIDPLQRQEVKERLRCFLRDVAQHMVATPNPEMLVLASRDPSFRNTLNRTDLNVPDGVGLQFATRLLGGKIPKRITGVDLVDMLSEVASEHGASMYLLGAEPGVGEDAAEILRARYPIRIEAHDGGPVERVASGEWRVAKDVIKNIRIAAPQILIVAFGHGKQEQWIADHLKELSSVRIAVGVGGALNYIAGRSRRGPPFMQVMGLEWLWRLALEPWRWRRIITAVIVFPYLVLTSHFSHRPQVS